jgi:hypothetical protein
MDTFGTIKSKILKKLTESYISKNKSEIKEIVTIMKSDKEFKDLYLFYEEIENKHIENIDTAKLYVEEIGTILKNKNLLIENTCNILSEKLKGIIAEDNKFYDALDQLLDVDSLKNIEKKVEAKKKIVEVVTTEKKFNIKESTEFTKNETLLHAVMANDFNSYYDEVLSEEEKIELKMILSLSKDELSEKITTIKESIFNKINSHLNESTDNTLKEKLNEAKNQVINSEISKYSYYKLKSLLTDIE